MAFTAALHTVDVQLADVDRHVYETLALRVARHPSERAESVAARVLAYCLEFTGGLVFGPGLAEPDAPVTTRAPGSRCVSIILCFVDTFC